MIERPILSSDEMVRAILSGRKTQTRRPVRPQPAEIIRAPYRAEADTFIVDDPRVSTEVVHPLCFVGDRLWVRECFAANVPGCSRGLSYRADHVDPRGDGPAHPMRWTPSIHMPRWASRLTLRVTDVRAERLQDISEADALAEGVSGWVHDERCETARDRFRVLWSCTYGTDSWTANPWVWAISFEKEEP